MLKKGQFPTMTTADLPDFAQKLCGRPELQGRLAGLPRPIVFTNGVFDVLHRGHVSYLDRARALAGPPGHTGGSLIVALNSDASAKRLGKGPDRPLNNELDRACVLAALASVSLVTWFDEDTPLEIIREIRPDILVKGGDYDMAKLAETQVVLAYGGTAQALSFVDGYSTTALVKKIRNS
jgi:rfaE bifunctional protein nucleotidyltransferase chain/domain